MKYLKTFEGFGSSSIQEKLTDMFKTREEIADAFLEALKENPEKALNSIISYYEDFLEQYFSVSAGEIPRDKTGKCTLSSSNLLSTMKFIPRFAGTATEPGIFIKDEDGDYIVNKSKLGLVEKITRNEVLNLISTHNKFSFKTIANAFNWLNPYKEVGALRRLEDQDVPHSNDDVDLIDKKSIMGSMANVETREEEAARKAAQAK